MIAPEAAGPDLQRVKHIGSQWNHHRVIIFGGQFDTHIRTGEDYDTRTLASLFVMEPSDKPKGAGLAFIPSSHSDYDGREHRAQRDRGSFVALTGDVDTGDHSLERIEHLVREFAGDAAWLIYSSAHSRPGDRRWRLTLPLNEPVRYYDWHDAQNALFDYLEAAGVKMDRALSRAAQPVYLPNVPAVHAKIGMPLRGPDNEPLYYRRATSGTNAPGLSLSRGAIAAGISAIQQRRERDNWQRKRIRAEAERRRASRPLGVGALIDDFNQSVNLETLLPSYGYEQCPGHPLDWRSPYQQGESYATRVLGGKWVSLSASDVGAKLGKPCKSGCFGDCYDLYVHFEHGGDHRAAFRALHSERKLPTSGSFRDYGDNLRGKLA
jgi:hypothetical protein